MSGFDQLIEAFQIFKKYSNEKYPTCCEHDTLHVLVSPSLVSEEDCATLKGLGFHASARDDNFYSNRFGSA